MACSPLAYKFAIRTELPRSFSGTGEIKLSISSPTRSIAIHTAPPLRLLSAVLILPTSERLLTSSTSYDKKRELLSLSFQKEAPEGEATLALRWTGLFADGSTLGYYKISYPKTSTEGESEQEGDYYTCTQFEPSFARRAFPCFDHPAKKATFDITLISRKGLDSISNSAEVSRVDTDGGFPTNEYITPSFVNGLEGRLVEDGDFPTVDGEWEQVSFATTPKMSTYIVAWAVGSFISISSSYISPLTGKEIPLRFLAATPFQHVEKGLGQFALDTLSRVMPIYEEMFDISYPLPKLDLLVCDSFDSGAMENFGLICGRPSVLLYDKATDGMSAMFRVLSTVSHEAAHQWFGNTVTLDWWSYLWLNESFATLMGEIIVLDKLEPDLNVRSTFVKLRRTAALTMDALQTSHPIEVECADDSEDTIGQIFDAISYEKGCSVLKMLSDLIGEDVFIRGVAKYLKEHLFGNTTSSDLWQALTETSGTDVRVLMESWTKKAGFPVVIVEERADGLTLRQNRFLASGPPASAQDDTIWSIPLNIKIFDTPSESRSVLMTTRELFIPLAKANEKVFTVNAEASGTFRVSYSREHLGKIAVQASKVSSPLSILDRTSILQDAIVLSEAGHTRTSSTLNLIVQLRNDPSYLVWMEIGLTMQRISSTWWHQPTPISEAIQGLGRDLFGPLVERMGYNHKDGETTDEKLWRTMSIAAAAEAKVPAVLEYLKRSFRVLLGMGDGYPDPAMMDSAGTAVKASVIHGGEKEYNLVLAMYENPPTPNHQRLAIQGLTASRDPQLIQRTAEMLTTPGRVNEMNITPFLAGMALNPATRRWVWEFVKRIWPVLEGRLKGTSALEGIVRISFENFTSEDDAVAVETFFADKDTTTFNQVLQQGLETVRAKSRWLGRDKEDVEGWLREKGFLTEL